MRRPLAALLAVALAAQFGPAGESAAPSAESLVEKLGDPAFREREAAGRELLQRGVLALPALERATAHPDPEIRQRADALAEQIKRFADSARLIGTKRVKLDYAGVPLKTAVADLKTKTGVPLTLDPHKVADPQRLVTVRTDELPAWEAIAAFCQAAGLKEIFHEEISGSDQAVEQLGRGQRIAYSIPGPGPTALPGGVPVLLADGKIAPLPGDRSTAVRVLALPAHFSGNRVIRGSGRVVLNLDVTPLPGVKWDEVTAVRVKRAEDETGRPIAVAHHAEMPPLYSPYGEVFLGGLQGQIVWGNIDYASPLTVTHPNPRIVPISLKTDDRAIKRLRIFEGTVIGEITLPNQTLATIDNLAKSVGASAFGPSESRYSVIDYKTHRDGRVTLKVRTEGLNPWNAVQFGGPRRVRIMAMAPVVWDGPAGSNGGVRLRYTDAAGKQLPAPMMRRSSATNDGFRQSWEMELQFPKRDGYGPPTKMTVTGDRPTTVEVPFRLRNVPLP